MNDYIEINAQIVEHHSPRNAVGLIENPVRYEWVGGDVARLSLYGLPESVAVDMKNPRGQVFNLGDLRLRIIEAEWYDVLVMLESPRAVANECRLRVKRFVGLIYRRCIITLAVWGLADYDMAIVPSWRDIRAGKWIRKRYARRGE